MLLTGAAHTRYRQLPKTFTPLKPAIDSLLSATQIAIEDLAELSYRYVLSQRQRSQC